MSWESQPLGKIAQINPRRPTIERTDATPTSFVPMDAVDEVLGELGRHEAKPFAKVRKGYTHFEEGDVIFAKITPCMQNGKHAVVRDLIDGFGFGSTEFHVVRPSKAVIPEWIHYFLRSKKVLDAAVRTFTGAVGQQRVPPSFLSNLVLPLPPVDEQRRIATRLKAQLAEVEAARQAAQAQLQDADLLRRKIVDAAFDRLLEWRPIAEVAKVQSGYAFKSEDFQTSGVRLLRNTNILPGKIYWDDVVCLDEGKAGRYPGYALEEGDVLISLDRPLISSGIKVARVGPADLPSLLLQRVGRFLLKPGMVDPDFLYAFLQSSRFIRAISGHDQSLGVPHISPGQVEFVELPLLSLDEQQQLATRLKTRLAEAAALHQAATAQLAEIERLPQRLLAQAFSPSTPQGVVA
jgi:type I restriction enzyme S subunit